MYEVIDRENLGGKLRVHPTASIARRASIDTSADVDVGERAVISEDVLILTHAHGPDAFDKSRITASPLVIGEGAFIGARAIILPQVSSIGPYSVVGAGAVVTRDVPPHSLVVGNPARSPEVL